MMVPSRFVENLSVPPISGVSGASAPFVPGMLGVVVFSPLRVRLAVMTISPGAAQKIM